MGSHRSAFFAYPAEPDELRTPIETAAESINSIKDTISVRAWPQLATFGAYIPNEVREAIEHTNVFVCDVTKPNFNVYYETGYAIGLGKPVAPIINASFAGAIADAQKDGFFDNVGYEPYENSQRLIEILHRLPDTGLANLYAKPINYQQPLYLLDSFRKTDFRNSIVAAIKESRVFYRSFDPVETARFSTVAVIADASASAGVVIPFLADQIDDAPRHNLRAAFLAGLSHGMGRQTLLLRFSSSAVISPADFRDDIIAVRSPAEIEDRVRDFARAAILAGQSISKPAKKHIATPLQEVTLGASAAENEFRTLSEYFVETAEYVKTMRGEVGVVAGRKGSGKTAIFFQARDSFRSNGSSIVVDLKPESHQLSLFREALLKVVDVGLFDHTLAAFWYFVILSEVILALKRSMEFRARHDADMMTDLNAVVRQIERLGINESGDFTSRINKLGVEIAREIERLSSSGKAPTPEKLTNIVFASGVVEIRQLIEKYTSPDNKLIFLFDNIDKGWPANGVNKFDVRLLRLLIEALDKVRKDFNAHHRDFKSVVFLRNDIYELMMELTPDRGKAGEIRIDWTDRAKLKQVIYKRLQTSSAHRRESFDQLWTRFFVPTVNGKDSFEYFLDHCLMRPRFLINIIENALANGINRGHGKVGEADCTDAVRQNSLYLMDDFGYEIRDVSGLSADILYSLIGVTHLLTKTEITDRLKQSGIESKDLDQALWLLLWYGLIGIVNGAGEERYIYDYDYHMKRLEAEIRNADGDVLYVTNPAIHIALNS